MRSCCLDLLDPKSIHDPYLDLGTPILGGKVWSVVALGLIPVAVSLFFCIYTKEMAAISKKWLFFVFLAFVCNADCAITHRPQQMLFHEQHGNMLIAFASIISLIICFILYVRSDRTDSKIMPKNAGIFSFVAGLSNVGLNLLVIILASTQISTNLICPVIGVGGLAVTLLFSQFAFKEKLRPAQ